MKPALFCILAGVSAVHLVSLFCNSGVVKALSKACLVPLILAIYVVHADRILVPVAAALLAGWAGDLLLLKKRNPRFFRYGLAAFFLGHICYSSAMLFFARPLFLFFFVLSLLAAVPLGVAVYRFICPRRGMRRPSAVYEGAILFMAVSAIQFFLARGIPEGALVCAGALSFIVSDTLLAYSTFHVKSKYSNAAVMFFYIIAQLCISLGLSGV